MQIAIIGTGYVGLTTGVCFAFLGHNVTCVDTDAAKIAFLQAGNIPIYEPGLAELLAEARANLSFTARTEEAIDAAEVVFVAVGTPPLPNGSTDLSFVRSAAQAVGACIQRDYTVVVNKSTVPIGSGNWVGAIVRDSFIAKKGRKPEGCFAVASNPEFLREGTAIHDTLYPDRVVIGSDDSRALEMLYTLYRPVLEQAFTAPAFAPRPEGLAAVPLIATDLASAELIKYAANAFLALKISYINEIAQLAEKVGADISQVAKGIGLDSRIGTRFLHAGVGWGGSCFGKDTSALISTAQEYSLTMPIVSAAREVNYRQRERVVEKLQAELKILKGRVIGLLGLAFKANTDDLREAPALEIARKLIDRGATVRAHDPVALDRARREYASLEIGWCETADQLAQDADALVLVTEWPEYRDLDWDKLAGLMKTPLVLDGRLFLDRVRLSKSGVRCVSVFA